MNYISKKIFNYNRNKYLKNIISNIGEIVEEEDKIICYVTKKLLKKNKFKYIYELNCNGINTTYKETKELIDYYNLNKPVYYIFDGINFESSIKLSSIFSHIVFKNCTFNNGIGIIWADNITLENNKYFNSTSYYSYGNSFIYGTAKKITIKNDYIYNQEEIKKYSREIRFGININVEDLSIINSNIKAEKKGEINIKSKNLYISKSTLESPEIYIDSDNISLDNSLLNSLTGVILENKNCNLDINSLNIHTPYIIYNNKCILNDKKTINNSYKLLKEIKTKRLELLKVLKYIKNNINNVKIKDLTKVLKK